MTNVLDAIVNIVQNSNLSLNNHSHSRNRMNAVGDNLEFFVKDSFCNSFNTDIEEKSINTYPANFSYVGNSNNPPDLILKGGDAVEVKKIESLRNSIPLNSSYPKSKLISTDTMLTSACRKCEDNWSEKDIVYVVGVVPKSTSNLKALWLVYGDCFASDKSIYERIRKGICDGVNEIEGIEFSPTNELARVNKVDPLGITYLRVRGMWGIDNPISIFSYLNFDKYLNNTFFLISILQTKKYLSFPSISRQKIEDLDRDNILELRDIRIKSPDNPAKLLEAKTIIYTVL